MKTQSVTLTLPAELVKEVKMLAAKRHTTVPALIAAALAVTVREDEADEETGRRS